MSELKIRSYRFAQRIVLHVSEKRRYYLNVDILSWLCFDSHGSQIGNYSFLEFLDIFDGLIFQQIS